MLKIKIVDFCFSNSRISELDISLQIITNRSSIEIEK